MVRRDGQACFRSLDDWLHTEIRGWTLAERIDDEQFARLQQAAAPRLTPFVNTTAASVSQCPH